MGEIIEDSPGLIDRIRREHWVGREREIAEAIALWQRVVQGEAQVLLLSGEPGVGKTRFVRELASKVSLQGASVLVGECYSEGSAPYAPLMRMIREFYKNSPQAVMELPSEVLTNLLPILPQSSQLIEKFPDLKIDTQAGRQQVVEGFVTFFSILSSEKPLLLFIDDVHWGDTDTLYLLRNLARRLRHMPVLIVMTYRESELETAPVLQEVLVDLNHERIALQLKLERFTRAETGDLLAAMFEEGITPEFLDGIFQQTEGNPFFIEEVCKSLVEAGQLSFRDGRWRRPVMAEIKIPQTIRTALQLRLQKLPRAAQDVLRMAAVLGGDFDFETLKRACELDEETLIIALESAMRAQLIAESQPVQAEGGRFSFVHVLIPTTLRESIIHVRRRRLHLRAARAIELVHPDNFENLAYQYDQAGDVEQAWNFYARAGDRAQRVAPGEAARFYQAALDRMPEEDQLARAKIMARLGYCLWVMDDIQNGLKYYQTAYGLFDLVGDLTKSGEMQRMIGRMYWQQAERSLALEHYYLALAIQEGGPETVELARAVNSISQMYMLAHDNDQGIEWGERALKLAKTLGAKDVVVSAMNNIGSSHAQSGDFETGIGIIGESLQLAMAAELPQDACRAYYNLGVMYQRQCRYRNAKDQMEKLYAYSSRFYSRTYMNLALMRLTWVNWSTGGWDAALDYQAQMVESSDILCATWMKRVAGMIDLDLGRVNDAFLDLEESLPEAVRANEYQTTVPHWGQLVRAYAALGQAENAIKTIDQIFQFISGTGYFSVESITPLLIACQVSSAMDTSTALETAQDCLTLLEQHAQQFQTEEAYAALAEARGFVLLGEEPFTAGENFRQAGAYWKMVDRRYDLARSLGYYGHALAAVGDLDSAQAAYRNSLEIIDSLSNQVDLELRVSFLTSPLVRDFRQASEALSRIQVDKEPGESASLLTKREVEVLKLVAEGMTNAQIANRLVLSPLTVNAHLRSIFNKLDVTTRTAAAHQGMEMGLV